MQAAGRREIEPFGIAAQLDDDCGKRRKPRRLLGNPQCVGEFCCFGIKQGFRGDAEIAGQPDRIGKARLAENLRGADPQ